MNALALLNQNAPAQIGQGVANAFSAGMQRAQTEQEKAERREYRQALGQLATEPENQNALAAVFQHNPQVGVQLMDRADDMAFGRDVASMVHPSGTTNALLGLSAPSAPAQPPSMADEAPSPSVESRGSDLSWLGRPTSQEDEAFIRMVQRDPMRALEIRSELRDNFVSQMEAESDFYGFAIAELSRATDQASWDVGLRTVMPRARALNLNLMRAVPREYPGPDGVRALMERAQPVKEQLDRMLRESNINADNERADRNTDSLIATRDRRASEYERRGRANEALRRRGQDLTDRRARSRSRPAPRARPARTPEGIVTVRTPAEARNLPSGTRFRDPAGQVRVVP